MLPQDVIERYSCSRRMTAGRLRLADEGNGGVPTTARWHSNDDQSGESGHQDGSQTMQSGRRVSSLTGISAVDQGQGHGGQRGWVVMLLCRQASQQGRAQALAESQVLRSWKAADAAAPCFEPSLSFLGCECLAACTWGPRASCQVSNQSTSHKTTQQSSSKHGAHGLRAHGLSDTKKSGQNSRQRDD